MWYNRLAGKTVKQKFDEVDGAVGALNEKLGELGAYYTSVFSYGANDLDSPPDCPIFLSNPNPNGYPTGISGNRCLILNLKAGSTYKGQLAIGFGADKLAYRRKSGVETWSDWVYFADQSYIDDKMRIVKSEEISFRPSTTVQFTNYTVTVPSGYSEVSREFYRTDSGGYQVLVSTFYARNYITYLSSADIGTVKGKVKVLCVKN